MCVPFQSPGMRYTLDGERFGVRVICFLLGLGPMGKSTQANNLTEATISYGAECVRRAPTLSLHVP